MNHAVVSLLNDGPAKVRCRTCHSDHDFRHEQAPPPHVDPRKAALFSQVLENVTRNRKRSSRSGHRVRPRPRKKRPLSRLLTGETRAQDSQSKMTIL